VEEGYVRVMVCEEKSPVRGLRVNNEYLAWWREVEGGST
jgi:hypothetical protein